MPSKLLNIPKMSWKADVESKFGLPQFDFISKAWQNVPEATPREERWKVFAEEIVKQVNIVGMTRITQSSNLAVAKEFLGQLDGIDLWYSQQRGGIWNLPDPILRNGKWIVKIYGMREVLQYIKYF